MHAREWMAAAAQSARARYVAEPTGLERRRGLISFLTWAFVLSEMFGRDGIGASAARASESDESTAEQGRADSAPQTLDMLAYARPSPDDASLQMGQPTPSSAGATTPVLPSASSVLSAEPRSDSADGAAAVRADTAPAGAPHGAGGALAQATDGGGTDNQAATLPEAIAGDGEHGPTSPLIQLSVSSDGLIQDGLLQNVGQIIDAVPVVGQVVGSTVEALSSTVDNILGSVTGLLGLNGADGAFASGGLIEIDMANAPLAFDAVQTAQGFTDYGIALELDFSGGVATSLSSTMAAPLADALNLGSGLLPMPDQLSLPDEAAQRSSSDVLA